MGLNCDFNMLNILVLLICACSVRSQAVCDGCLCNPPDIDASTVKPIYLVRKITGDSSISWALDVNITWTAPLNTSHDYAVQFTKHHGDNLRCSERRGNWQFPSGCPIKMSQQHVTGERYTERDLSFGYRYIFDVCLYNTTWNALASTSICLIDIFSPDCYEVTQDEDFCRSQPIEVSGKPVNASLTSFTRGQDAEGNSTVNANIMWGTPIQVNGAINRYSVESYDVTMPGDRDDLQTVFQREDNTSMVYEAQIPGLSLHTQYRVEITPWSILPPNDLKGGLKTELIFTTPSSLDLPQTTATTDANSNPTTMIQTTMPDGIPPIISGSDVLTMIVVSSIGIITVIVLLVLAIVCVRRRNRRMNTPYTPKPQPISPTPPIVPREDVDPVFKNKEVRHDQVEIRERLGSGQFGVVYSGSLLGRTDSWKHVHVAVKMVKDDVSDLMKLDLLNEIRLMIELGGHQHVLEVIACCTVKFPYYMVTEVLKYGDLLHFLRKCNKPQHIEKDTIYDIKDLQRHQIARQIASGMVFISSKRFYHGDLAARNILVGTDLMVKISDFGLSSDIYQVGYQRLSPERKRPIRWASMETNIEGKCTIQSDIWSYGITLYEIFTNGEMPYKDMDTREVIRRVRDGYRMEKPENCPDDVYKMMSLCWHEKPIGRPAFKNIFNFFDTKIASKCTLLYWDVENEAQLSEKTAAIAQTRPNSSTNDGSTALSGESVNMKDWRFEREPSTRTQADLYGAIAKRPNCKTNDGSTALSGESVNMKDWRFEREPSTRTQADLNGAKRQL